MLMETFTQLARDPAHWYFELMVGGVEMLGFDLLVGALAWPAIKRHIHRDVETADVEEHKHVEAWFARHFTVTEEGFLLRRSLGNDYREMDRLPPQPVRPQQYVRRLPGDPRAGTLVREHAD